MGRPGVSEERCKAVFAGGVCVRSTGKDNAEGDAGSLGSHFVDIIGQPAHGGQAIQFAVVVGLHMMSKPHVELNNDTAINKRLNALTFWTHGEVWAPSHYFHCLGGELVVQFPYREFSGSKFHAICDWQGDRFSHKGQLGIAEQDDCIESSFYCR